MATRFIVRVANTDLKGEKKIGIALTKIKGVSMRFAQALCYVSGIDPNVKAGDLTEQQEAKLNELIRAPGTNGIPEWMLNRRHDPETGEDFHLIGSDVAFVKENDLKRMRKLRTYKGQRHSVGLPVRGQRTKSNFRRNKSKGAGRKKERRPATEQRS